MPLMLEHFINIPPLKKILEFQEWKKDYKTYRKKISNQKVNQWLKTYKMNFVNWKTNKLKVLNFKPTSYGSWRVKNAPKLFSKCLNKRICKIKQYLNYIMMIVNEKIVAILRTFSNLEKNLCENLYTKETTS